MAECDAVEECIALIDKAAKECMKTNVCTTLFLSALIHNRYPLLKMIASESTKRARTIACTNV